MALLSANPLSVVVDSQDRHSLINAGPLLGSAVSSSCSGLAGARFHFRRALLASFKMQSIVLFCFRPFIYLVGFCDALLSCCGALISEPFFGCRGLPGPPLLDSRHRVVRLDQLHRDSCKSRNCASSCCTFDAYTIETRKIETAATTRGTHST